MAVNYQLELDKILQGMGGEKPSLLLHACCAPCSSYVLEYLSARFNITLDFYNPNISPAEEFYKRNAELARLIKEAPFGQGVKLLCAEYDDAEFYSAVKGLEHIPEGGERCFACYRLRLEHTATIAAQNGFDYFCSTLTISPHKNANKLNEIGAELSEKYGVRFLPSDFKKRGGFKRSGELSQVYGLYRQDYCGCIFSKAEAEKRNAALKTEVNAHEADTN